MGKRQWIGGGEGLHVSDIHCPGLGQLNVFFYFHMCPAGGKVEEDAEPFGAYLLSRGHCLSQWQIIKKSGNGNNFSDGQGGGGGQSLKAL